MTDPSSQPLSGVKVIDFSQVMLGPVCTQVLADYGADVIKIERPVSGDLSRTSLGNDPDGLNNPVFRSLNRNKRSIVLDLRKEGAKSLIYEMVRSADVVVNNFRPGVMDRMGFGHPTLSELNPRVISAFGSGFGVAGPMSHKGGQDTLAQAMSGAMARRVDATTPLAIYPTALADYTAGMHLVQAILLALLQRARTGRGQAVAVSLFESMLAMQMQEAAVWLQRGGELNWAAFPLTGAFATRDGALVLVGAFKANPLRDICTALELPDLSVEAAYATFEGMVENRDILQRTFRERFATDTTSHWLDRLEAQDLLCAPVLSLAEALDHAQTRSNGSILGEGPDRVVGSPLRMEPGAFQFRRAPPGLGSDAPAILAELGCSSDRVAELTSSGAVALQQTGKLA